MTSIHTRYGTARVTLPSAREILITRTFDAPPSLVFDAWTTPSIVRRWWGGGSPPLVVCDIDLRLGGSWRYATAEPDGTQLAWHGTFLEVDAPHRLRSTEVFEGHPEAEAQNTLTLAVRDGGTECAISVLHSSRNNRDRHLESGMELGLQASLDQMDRLLEQLQGPSSLGGAGASR